MPKLKLHGPPSIEMRVVYSRKKPIKPNKKSKKLDRFVLHHDGDHTEFDAPRIAIDPLFQITIIARGQRYFSPQRIKHQRHSIPSVAKQATVDDGDPRACPKDINEFRLALAFELDRLRERKFIREE